MAERELRVYSVVKLQEMSTVKSIINSAWLRRSGLLCAGAALTLLVSYSWSKPAVAQSEDHNIVARAILDLQQSNNRWIEIDLTRQRLIAWEGPQEVYAIVISTGKDGSPTPTGSFAIQSKYEVARMRGDDYDVPDVPYVMYYSGSYGIHGAYWHNNFGTPVSHGCTNVAVNHAQWLFNWASVGTQVVVHY